MTLPPGLHAHATRTLIGTALTVEDATAYARGDAATAPPAAAVTAAAVLAAGWAAAEDPAA